MHSCAGSGIRINLFSISKFLGKLYFRQKKFYNIDYWTVSAHFSITLMPAFVRCHVLREVHQVIQWWKCVSVFVFTLNILPEKGSRLTSSKPFIVYSFVRGHFVKWQFTFHCQSHCVNSGNTMNKVFQITDNYILNPYVYIRTLNILKIQEAWLQMSFKRSV